MGANDTMDRPSVERASLEEVFLELTGDPGERGV